MSHLNNRMKEQAEDLKGKVKEGIGKATGDQEKVGEGQRDQADAKLDELKNKTSEKAEDAKDRVKGFTDK